jgi:NAD(P)-dependent dehydrogenase (short-subunit alcohol dehydrogenase family)
LAALLGQRQITVNSISPGAIATDMSAWLATPVGNAQVKGLQAIARVGKPAAINAGMTSSAGPDGRWFTCQVISVSGGTKL